MTLTGKIWLIYMPCECFSSIGQVKLDKCALVGEERESSDPFGLLLLIVRLFGVVMVKI